MIVLATALYSWYSATLLVGRVSGASIRSSPSLIVNANSKSPFRLMHRSPPSFSARRSQEGHKLTAPLDPFPPEPPTTEDPKNLTPSAFIKGGPLPTEAHGAGGPAVTIAPEAPAPVPPTDPASSAHQENPEQPTPTTANPETSAVAPRTDSESTTFQGKIEHPTVTAVPSTVTVRPFVDPEPSVYGEHANSLKVIAPSEPPPFPLVSGPQRTTDGRPAGNVTATPGSEAHRPYVSSTSVSGGEAHDWCENRPSRVIPSDYDVLHHANVFPTTEYLANTNLRFDATIVLSGGLDASGEPNPMTKQRIEAAGSVASRTAYWVSSGAFSANKPPLLSSKGVPITEGRSDARYLAIRFGIPAKRIILEENSKDTLGNAFFTRGIVAGFNFSNVLVVTNAFHMKRTKLAFDWIYGLQASNVVSDVQPEYPVHLYYLAAPDVPETPQVQRARQAKERSSIHHIVCNVQPHVIHLADLSAYMYLVHKAYALESNSSEAVKHAYRVKLPPELAALY